MTRTTQAFTEMISMASQHMDTGLDTQPMTVKQSAASLRHATS